MSTYHHVASRPCDSCLMSVHSARRVCSCAGSQEVSAVFFSVDVCQEKLNWVEGPQTPGRVFNFCRLLSPSKASFEGNQDRRASDRFKDLPEQDIGSSNLG